MAPGTKGSILMAILVGICGKKPGAFVGQGKPWWYSAVLSLASVVALATPLCLAVAVFRLKVHVLVNTGVADPAQYGNPPWHVAILEAYALLVAPYFLWILAMYTCHGLLVRLRRVRLDGGVMRIALSFPLPYVCGWCLPVSWPFVMAVANAYLPFTPEDAYYVEVYKVLLYGIPCSGVVVAVVLVSLGIRKSLILLKPPLPVDKGGQ